MITHSAADAGFAGLGSLRPAGRKESTEVIMLRRQPQRLRSMMEAAGIEPAQDFSHQASDFCSMQT